MFIWDLVKVNIDMYMVMIIMKKYQFKQSGIIHMIKEENIWYSKCIKEKYTRVVGFLTPVGHWNKTRRETDFPNRQFYSSISAQIFSGRK